MRSLFLLLVAAFVFQPSFAQQKATEEFIRNHSEEFILHFHSDIRVQKNCTVLITEHIRVLALGERIQRGIYREIPLEYQYKGGHYTVGFELISAKRDGKSENYHTENADNGIRIYFGSKDVYLTPDIYEYELTYRVDHVLGLKENYDELYWNVNGNGWDFTIDTLSADLYYPEKASLLQYAAYTGAFGEDGKDFTADTIGSGMHFETTRPMTAKENLTIAVGWSKDHLVYPTKMENFLYWLKVYALWLLMAVGIIGTLLYNYITWWRFGRDPKPGTIMPRYRAPEGLSPAECAYIQKEGRPTDTMFGATLISLATQGKMRIESEDSTNFKLTKTNDEKEVKNTIESHFFAWLFGNSTSIRILSRTYDPHIKSCQEELKASVDEKLGDLYFLRNSKYKLKQFLVPILTLIISGITYFFSGGSPVPIFAGFGIMIIINTIFSRLYEQPTAEGRKVMDEIAGFVLYMQYADKERIRLMNPPTMNFEHFEENLAYAIALGVADKWAGQFEPAELERMYSGAGFWYTGMMFASFNSFSFSELSNTISSASIPPSSSSGSGGGGFSGGGGGGGGGGGW